MGNREHVGSFRKGPDDTNVDKIAGDRRSDRRYDIVRDLRWKVVRHGVTHTGTGSTLNLSSGGILFETDRQLPTRRNVELSISWPALLDNVAPLQLVVQGQIVRTSGRRTAIRIVQHEFRTVKPPQ
jgi:hypothetical protein